MNARAPKVILLDWDGTLADVVPISAAALNATRMHMGQSPLPDDVARNESAKALHVLFPNATDRDYFISTHAAISKKSPPPPIEGAQAFVEYLASLRTDGVYIGIISNKPTANIVREMKQFGWEGTFDVIVGSDSVSKGKPHTEALSKALEDYAKKDNLVPKQIVYIGDSTTDAQFAKNCGVRFIGIDESKFNTLEPQERCNNLHELLNRMRLLMGTKRNNLPDF
jgi:phosphoglycolate phosphatase-like HAD superfamily hydrolase